MEWGDHNVVAYVGCRDSIRIPLEEKIARLQEARAGRGEEEEEEVEEAEEGEGGGMLVGRVREQRREVVQEMKRR